MHRNSVSVSVWRNSSTRAPSTPTHTGSSALRRLQPKHWPLFNVCSSLSSAAGARREAQRISVVQHLQSKVCYLLGRGRIGVPVVESGIRNRTQVCGFTVNSSALLAYKCVCPDVRPLHRPRRFIRPRRAMRSGGAQRSSSSREHRQATIPRYNIGRKRDSGQRTRCAGEMLDKLVFLHTVDLFGIIDDVSPPRRRHRRRATPHERRPAQRRVCLNESTHSAAHALH
eukprot:6189055-Pleurochrysis_carterae.AAC.2